MPVTIFREGAPSPVTVGDKLEGRHDLCKTPQAQAQTSKCPSNKCLNSRHKIKSCLPLSPLHLVAPRRDPLADKATGL